MNFVFRMPSKPARLLVRLLYTIVAVFVCGAFNLPPANATTTPPTPVAVDQSPLTIRQTISPDITLMLDDSGSMNWDFMPDAQYLGGNFSAVDEQQQQYQATHPSYTPTPDTYVSADALRNTANNGVYFNPSATYTVPVKADGSSWPTPTDMGHVYIDPFSSTPTTVDIAHHNSPWLCNYNGYNNSLTSTYYPCPSSLYYAFPYFTAFPTSGNTAPPVPSCGTDSLDPAGSGMCRSSTSGVLYVPVYQCNVSGTTGSPQYNPQTGYCENGAATYTWLFTYTTAGNTAGTYVRHYVGESASDCTTALAAPTAGSGADCVSDTATQQKVAIWFSYYRKRILMAKSGLMMAFSSVNAAFRVGFGSINGTNDTALPAPTGTFGQNSQNIAEVQPFDTNCINSPTTCTPGQLGTQRYNFWHWVAGLSPKNSTPLRIALDAVGKYYENKQPWQSMVGDPGYSVTGTNSPIACRLAYTILTTDGFWNQNYSSNTTLGASDTSGPTVTAPNGQSYTYAAASPYSGGDAVTVDNQGNPTSTPTPSLADVAMYYWKTDLQSATIGASNIPNEVPPSAQDPAFWQHMTTFTMGLGFTPTDTSGNPINMDSVFAWANGTGLAIPNFSWPQPYANSLNNIADLAHAGLNGHGGYYSATSPQTFISGLEDALARATSRVGTGASLSANSTQLNTGTVIYQAKYYTGTWQGELDAYSVNPASGAISTNSSWLPGNGLKTGKGVVTFPNRNIWSYNTSTNTPEPFPSYSATSALPKLSTAQLAALDPSGTNSTANEGAMVDYLRGDNTNEQKNGGTFRNRSTTVLGDIVDSQPIYVGAPDATEFNSENFYGQAVQTDSSGNPFSPFYNWANGYTDSTGTVHPGASKRKGMIYVAANDGMLHAFDAQTGAEVYAYLPGALLVSSTDPVTGLPNPLSNLSNTGYGSALPHQFYNDGELTIADAYVQLKQTGDTAPQWHTILVGTTGRGPARAVYALDLGVGSDGVSPSITPLWERYAGDSSTLDTNSGYIGEMVGKPVIAQTNATATSSSWSVLIGNGYNSPNGVAALLQFDLATGALSVHQTTDATTGNGLAAPFAWMDVAGDGVSDIAYAGDYRGQVWSFPLNDSTGANPTPSSTGKLLFTAMDASLNRQPITAGVRAAQNPADNSVWLFFGTGKYLTASDVTNTNVQTWYGIIVQSSNSTQVSNLSAGRSALAQRSIIYENAGNPVASPPVLPTRAVTAMPSPTDITCASRSSCKSGWYMDLVSPTSTGGTLAQGERIVVPNAIQGSLLVGTTRIPQPANQSSDPCNPAGGGWIMALDAFTGTDPSTNFFDTNGDGYVNSSDMITLSNGQQVAAAGVGFNSLPNAPIFVGGVMEVSFDNSTNANLKTGGSSGRVQRVSWQELISN